MLLIISLCFSYMRNASATQLSEAWISLLTLVREGCSLSPQAQFLLAALLHELMIKCCPLEERKDQKDLQDVTAKVSMVTKNNVLYLSRVFYGHTYIKRHF